MRGRAQAKRVRVGLAGVRQLDLVVGDGENGEDADHADWAEARIELGGGGRPRTAPFLHRISIRPGQVFQSIDGFGASDCWSMHKIADWSEPRKERVARLLFSTDAGIGLSIWRFNIGAGKNPKITHPWRSSECFETSPGVYDWTRQAGQRWFLKSAVRHGLRRFTAFALSPPSRMTRNGLTFCTRAVGSTNLKPGFEAAYARFLVDVVQHFRSAGIPFGHISPVNEPQWDWNSAGQEGNRASNADLTRIYAALAGELARRKVPVEILPFESGTPGDLTTLSAKASRVYGTPFGNYLSVFGRQDPFANGTGRLVAGHSYWANAYRTLVWERRRLRAALDRLPGWRYWQTEYCVMRGPRGEQGWVRDLGMTCALWVARIIHYDLSVANASAWHWWTALSPEKYKDGLIYTDYRKPGDAQNIIESRTLWVLGNFSRFIRPGMRRIGLEGANHGINGLLASAYAEPSSKRVVVVLVNMRDRPERLRLALPQGRSGVRAFVTSPDRRDRLRGYAVDAARPISLPARSVVTLVID